MTLEENKAVVRRLFDLTQHGDLDGLDAVMAPDFCNHALGQMIGLGPWRVIYEAIGETIPDHVTTIDDIMAEGDKVVVRSTLKGTHQGSALPMLGGIKPEGRPIEWQFIHIYRLRDGKIVEHWAQRNDFEVRLQLGGM